jgi:DNA-3-methyladenine glycosylase
MRARRGLERVEDLCSGPGKLTAALGIGLEHDASDLAAGPVRIGPAPRAWRDVATVTAKRVGITRAVDLPWRFCAGGTRSVSRPWPPALRSFAQA